MNSPDHRGARVLHQVFEIVGRAEHRLVAGGDDVAEAEAPDIRQQADADRAALRDEADIARQPGRVAQLTADRSCSGDAG